MILRPKAFANITPRVQARYEGGLDGVIVLPVVRIERRPDNPHDAMVEEFARKTGRQRRRYRRGDLTAAEIVRLAKEKGRCPSTT